MLSKEVKARIKRNAVYRHNRHQMGPNWRSIIAGRIRAIQTAGRKRVRLGFVEAMEIRRGKEEPVKSPEVVLPAPNPLELVYLFEASERFRRDFTEIMIKGGNEAMKAFRSTPNYHAFGYLPVNGKARIRVEFWILADGPHTTFTMPLKLSDIEARDTKVIGELPYGRIAEVFEAETGVKTHDRWRFLINEAPDFDD